MLDEYTEKWLRRIEISPFEIYEEKEENIKPKKVKKKKIGKTIKKSNKLQSKSSATLTVPLLLW